MQQSRCDIIILGGGPTGLALALALGGIGAEVLVIEARPLEQLADDAHDGRVTAIAAASQRMLEAIGAWEGMAAQAQPILDIEVGEPGTIGRVHYDHAELDEGPLGWIVENRLIRRALIAALAACPGVTVEAPARAATIDRDPSFVRLTLEDGTRAQAPLLAVCEGRFSTTRGRLGIRARQKRYGQTGIVCTLAHEKPHHGLAVERFFADGPFAMLPMIGSADDPHRSSIVWALEDGLAADVGALAGDAFAAEVQARFGDMYGRLTLSGRRWSYPLVLVRAESYTTDRVALVGDTACGIHPIAGQGWNLALRDVAALAEITADRLRLGLDPGDAAALAAYAGWRRFDGTTLVAVTDGINGLFANDVFPLALARETGLRWSSTCRRPSGSSCATPWACSATCRGRCAARLFECRRPRHGTGCGRLEPINNIIKM